MLAGSRVSHRRHGQDGITPPADPCPFLGELDEGLSTIECSQRSLGLSDSLAAYEARRALRMIGYMFDQQGSPVTSAGVFVPQIADAVLHFALRGERQPFGAEDVAFVFLDTCTPADAPREMRDHAREAIASYCGQAADHRQTGGVAPATILLTSVHTNAIHDHG